jgi:hypothetical protein
MIPNYASHSSHTWSPIAGTMAVTKINFSMVNPNIVNSQHSCSWMNINDVIIKYTKHQIQSENLTKKLQITTYPSTLQTAGRIPTHN